MKKTYKIENLCCANCAAEMEAALAKIEGVHSARVNFLTQKIIIDAEENSLEDIAKQMRKICKRIEPDCVISA